MVIKLIKRVKLNNIFYKYVNCYNTEIIVVKDNKNEEQEVKINTLKDLILNNSKKVTVISSILIVLITIIAIGDIKEFMAGFFAITSATFIFLIISIVPVLIIALYFLPIIISIFRKHSNKTPIILITIFLGWTIIGWIIALMLAFIDNTES